MSSGRVLKQLDDEDTELWRQLRRKHDFERRVSEKRSQFVDLQARRRRALATTSDSAASIQRLEIQDSFLKACIGELRHDLELQREFARDKIEVLVQQKELQQLRALAGRLQVEKAELQYQQQSLLLDQKSAETERNSLLVSLQKERIAITDCRKDRICLWQRRHALELEIARHSQEDLLQAIASTSPQGAIMVETVASVGPARNTQDQTAQWAAGVRLPATHDAPVALAMSSADVPESRWEMFRATGFGSGVVPRSCIAEKRATGEWLAAERPTCTLTAIDSATHGPRPAHWYGFSGALPASMPPAPEPLATLVQPNQSWVGFGDSPVHVDGAQAPAIPPLHNVDVEVTEWAPRLRQALSP